MTGTVSGGQLAAKKNIERDPDFYRKIGTVGGHNGTGHQFAHGRVSPSVAGAIGGKRKKGYKKNKGEL